MQALKSPFKRSEGHETLENTSIGVFYHQLNISTRIRLIMTGSSHVNPVTCEPRMLNDINTDNKHAPVSSLEAVFMVAPVDKLQLDPFDIISNTAPTINSSDQSSSLQLSVVM